jgi:hypothetical protein
MGWLSKAVRKLRRAGRKINRAAINIGKSAEKAAHGAGHGVEHLAHEVGKTLDKTGRELDNLGRDVNRQAIVVGKYVEEHGDDGDAVLHGGRELLDVVREAAVAGERDHGSAPAHPVTLRTAVAKPNFRDNKNA